MVARLVSADSESGKLPDVVLSNLGERFYTKVQSDARFAPIGNAGGGVGQRYDRSGEALAAKLELGAGGDIVLTLLGDSTGDEATEWFKRWTDEIATQHPALRVEYTLWSDTAQAYPAKSVLQEGSGYTPSTQQVVLSDTFNRTATSASGSQPEVGSPWSGASNGWLLDGAKLVATTSGADLVSAGGAAGDSTARLNGVTFDTTPGSTLKQIRLYTKYIDATNHVFVFVNMDTAGTVTWGVFKRINNVATSVFSGPSLGLTPSAPNTFDMSISIAGTTVSATVNKVSMTGALTSADAAALANATSMAIGTGGNSSTAGTAIDSASYQVGAPGIGQKMTVYNGSMPGKTLDYQLSRLAAMVPERPDLTIFSSSHNYASASMAAYLSALNQAATLLRNMYPDADFALSSQNPEFAPFAFVKQHLDRMVALRTLALRNGWGYLPVVEAFMARADGGKSLVQSDGVHPTVEGSALWFSVASTYLAAKSLLPS